MTRTTTRMMVTASALSMLLGGCLADGELESTPSPGDETTAVQSAIGESWSTGFSSQLATAAANDRVFAVWMNTAGEVVGQMFNLSGGALDAARVYSTGTYVKSNPTVGYNFNNTFLVAWEEAYAADDHDIVGVRTNNLGVPTSSTFGIQTSGAYEMAPSITGVPTQYGGPAARFLVTYSRRDFNIAGGPGLAATWVETTGFPSPGAIAIVPQGGTDFVTEPQAVYGGGRILFQWNNGGAFSSARFRFGSPSTLALGPIGAVGAAGTTVKFKQAAYNTTNGTFAMTWLGTTGSVTAVHSQTFGPGCESMACANPEWDVRPTKTGGSIVSVTRPVITAVNVGFALFATKVTSTGAYAARFDYINAQGQLGSTFDALLSCSGASQGTPGGTSRSFAATTPPSGSTSARAYLIYDPMCLNSPKVAAVAWDMVFSMVPFPVSN